MPRVGIIVSRIDKGAAELLEVNLAIELSKLDIDVFLLPQTSSQFYSDSTVESKIQDQLNNKIIRLDYDFKFKFFRKILVVRSMRFDFLVSQNRGTDLISALCSYGLKTKMIVGMHHAYDKSEINGLLWRFWNFTVKKAFLSYHISQFSLLRNRLSLKLSEQNSVIVNNAIEIPNFEMKSLRKHFNLLDDDKIIVSASRVNYTKGADLNVDIAIPLLKEFDNLYYIYFGEFDSSDQNVELLRKKIDENGLTSKLIFAGYREDAKQFISDADVLLHFARKEAFGLTLLEAYVLGVAIVTSDVEGIPELFEDTLIKPISLSKLDEARDQLKLILNSPDLIKKRSAKSLIAKYSNENRAKRICSFFSNN